VKNYKFEETNYRMEGISEIKEGGVTLVVPSDPLKKKAFYNPSAALSRDMTVLFIKALKEKDLEVCDSLAGTGARSVRILKETGKAGRLWIVERSHEAVDFINHNLKVNGLANKAYVFEMDANVFLYQHAGFFDFVDIDPFGSPVYYLEGAVRAAKRKAYIAVTATDQKALMGFSPRTTMRRYGIRAIKTDMKHEIGLRNLIATIAFAAARYEYVFIPMISFHHIHYYRVIGRLEKRHAYTGDYLKENTGIIHYCPYCLDRDMSQSFSGTCYCGREFRPIYPTWIGSMHDREHVLRMLALVDTTPLQNPSEAKKILKVVSRETNTLPYNIHEIASHYKLVVPPRKYLLSKLPDSSAVHHLPYGVKTSARLKDVLEVMKEFKEKQTNAVSDNEED